MVLLKLKIAQISLQANFHFLLMQLLLYLMQILVQTMDPVSLAIFALEELLFQILQMAQQAVNASRELIVRRVLPLKSNVKLVSITLLLALPLAVLVQQENIVLKLAPLLLKYALQKAIVL